MTEQPHSWTANTAQEALDILDAARKLIEAGMLSLAPGDGAARWKAQQTAPLHLTITMDETPLGQLVADRHASRHGGAL
ncbi:hypothetical protein ACFWV1_26380 [Streptomyces sp. NPDC058700]|uniref:hypothetical protein n=1 Tax=Streptomyces sp. NPDC058700 TaxID=3346607 RepID=UPI00364EABB5